MSIRGSLVMLFRKLLAKWMPGAPGKSNDSAVDTGRLNAANQARTQVNQTLGAQIKNLPLDELSRFISEQNVNQTDEHDHAPLYYAVRFNREEVVRWLFALGAKFDSVLATPLSPKLEVLLEQKHAGVLQACLDNGLLLPRLHKLVPVMHSAVAAGCDLEFLQVMMAHGAALEPYKGHSVLYSAINSNAAWPVLEWLLATETHRVNLGKDAENIAAVIIGSSIEVNKKCQLLLRCLDKSPGLLNAPHHADEDSIFELALASGQAPVVKLLISVGADFSAHIAQLYRVLEKADVDELMESTALKHSVKSFGLMSYEALKRVIKNDISWQSEAVILDILGNQRLSLFDKQELVLLALDHGGDVNMARQEVTPVLYLCRHLSANEKPELLQLLLEAGGKTEMFGRSAFFTALKSNNVEALTLLLNHGANVNFVDADNRSLANYIIDELLPVAGESRANQLIAQCLPLGLDVSLCTDYQDTDETVVIDMFSHFACANLQLILTTLLDAKAKVGPDSNLIYYAIRFVTDLQVQLSIIATNPTYRYADFYGNGIRSDYSEAIGIALLFKHEKLVNALLDRYPKMKTYNRVKTFYATLVERDNISVATIKRLIERDPDLNRRYVYQSGHGNYKYRVTESVAMAKAIADDKYSHEPDYLELLEFMFQHGAEADIGEQHVEKDVDTLSIFCVTANPDKVHRPLFDLLIRYGADPRTPKGSMHESSIHAITQRLPKMSDEGIVAHLEYFAEKTGINVTERNKLETDLLLGAGMNCKPKTVAWLLAHGADIHTHGGHDNAPVLHKTIANYPKRDAIQRAKTVQVLLEHGADINEIDGDETTPLMKACYFGAYLAAKTLLEYGADVHICTQDCDSAINRAVLGDYSFDYRDDSQLEYVKGRIVQALHEYGADLNNVAVSETPLLSTIRLKRRHLFTTLLDCGASPNTPNHDGMTPLMLALRSGDMYFVNSLLSRDDIDINAKSNDGQDAFSYLMLRNNAAETQTLYAELLRRGAVPGRYLDGDTLLHLVCVAGNEDLLPNVVQTMGQSINETNDLGQTPLMNVILGRNYTNDAGRKRMLTYLCDQGANINALDSEGLSALAHCIGVNNLALGKGLIAIGADATLRTPYGETLLHLVLHADINQHEQRHWLTCLTQAGADINASDGVDVCLLAAVKLMDFIANAPIGFITHTRSASSDEDALIDALIAMGAGVAPALVQAKEQQLGHAVTDYLQSKLSCD